MLSIALIQLGPRHTEIIGGIISMLLRKNVNQINLYTVNYRASFVPYYRKLFKKVKKLKWIFSQRGVLKTL